MGRREKRKASPREGMSHWFTEGVVERIFPARVVDGPVDLALMLGGEVVGPHFAIAFVVDHVKAIDDGHAARECGLGFDVEEMVGV